MLLTARWLYGQLSDARTVLADLAGVMQQPPQASVVWTLWMQQHPDGPDEVVGRGEYLQWLVRQPAGHLPYLQMEFLFTGLVFRITSCTADGTTAAEVFPDGDDDQVVARYLQLAVDVLGARP